MIDMNVFNDGMERLSNKFNRNVLYNSLAHHVDYGTNESVYRKMEMKALLRDWCDRLDCSNPKFPRCVLSEADFLGLGKLLGSDFPIMLYTRREFINILKKCEDEKTVKAYECYVEPVKMEGLLDFNLPVKIKMRLLYLPQPETTLMISYSHNGHRVIKSLNQVIPFDSTKRAQFVQSIKSVSFDLLNLIVKGAKANDPDYVEEWIHVIVSNLT